MPVERFSVTLPSELGKRLRALAKARGETVSALVTDAIAREVRFDALDVALTAMEREFGPVPEQLVEKAMRQLAVAERRAHRRKTRKRA